MLKNYVVSPVILLLLLAFTMTGCGGAGGESSPRSAPTPYPILQVPMNGWYDFGVVTTGNSPAPLEVRIKNNGTAALRVSNIVLSDQINFSLNSNGGSKPCASNSPTIPAADSCTFQVGFRPGADGTFTASFQIHSNDSFAPVVDIGINGTAEPVATLTVRINQLETSCPISELVNAYVSVTDQGGYSLTGLLAAGFTVTEEGAPLGITNATYVDIAYEDIAITAVMDYSSYLTDFPEAIAGMERGFINLFSGLRPTDLGEIVKFDSEFAVVQPFTSNKTELTAAVSAAFDMGIEARLYDAVFQAVDDAATKTNYRRAVVVINDGKDTVSNHSLDEVITNANTKGVPIFTIEISPFSENNLQRMANETGGQYFEANMSQNLATIFQQLTSVLYKNQYILTFNQSVLGSVGTANLNIKATTPLGKFGDDTVIVTSCH